MPHGEVVLCGASPSLSARHVRRVRSGVAIVPHVRWPAGLARLRDEDPFFARFRTRRSHWHVRCWIAAMHLQAHISLVEFRLLLDQFAPIRIHLDGDDAHAPDERPERWIELFDPQSVVLVEGRGLRVECAGVVRYDLGPIPARLRLRSATLLVIPSVQRVDGASALGITLEIEKADLALVPGAVDQMIVEKVNAILAPQATKVSWRIDRALDGHFTLPTNLVPLEAFHVDGTWREVLVEREQVVFDLDVACGITRHALGLPSADQDRALRTSDERSAVHEINEQRSP